jgi:hypothetical protein
MFSGLSIMGSVNLLCFVGTYFDLKHNPGSGPEGIGTALIMMTTLIFSFLLTSFGVRQIYAEAFGKTFSWRSATATAIALSPLLLFFFRL